ncbi:carbohydrate ABC transporter permease [Actinopolymorpha singaporensis]|uniref:Multiple sugar transport system permease protein n=1 Tax=Actinopolymorpha singaporensis TaxID=117157 RepID=A0A1H1YQV2_9ACTN|nr:carbohydrate ABC transporter permease [Actinopolymorpha singaporensis]SDT23777.1 multiple sugar transport system permease protein [Actinopolymorpha singaporensis]
MLFPRVGRRQPMLRIAWWLVVAFLCLGITLHLFPFYFMLITSFKSGQEVLQFPPTWWPHDGTLAGWRLVVSLVQGGNTAATTLMDGPFWKFFLNSVHITFWVLVLGIPITSLAAYANSKLQTGPLARWSFLFFIGTLMMPAALTLIPNYLLTRNFPFALPDAPSFFGSDTLVWPNVRIWDTHWAVILPIVFQAFNFLLFKGFFDTIPNSVIQAARVDGGSEFNIFRRIVLPMSVPVYAVAIWGAFSGAWDQFLWPLVVLQSPDKMPASVEIYNLLQKFTQAGATDADQASAAAQQMQQILSAGMSWNGLMVLGILQSLPVFIAFVVCREYLLRGIRLRGLK